TMFVANGDPANPLLEFAAGAHGNVAPTTEVAGGNTGLSSIRALALVPPSVTTGTAGGTPSAVRLTGTSNPQASDAHYQVEWGTHGGRAGAPGRSCGSLARARRSAAHSASRWTGQATCSWGATATTRWRSSRPAQPATSLRSPGSRVPTPG